MKVVLPIATVTNFWPPDVLPEGKRAYLTLQEHSESEAAPVGEMSVSIQDHSVYQYVRDNMQGSYIPRTLEMEIRSRVFEGEVGKVTALTLVGIRAKPFTPSNGK